jgi:glycosyltransferase involved in cell wall biosynthesis
MHIMQIVSGTAVNGAIVTCLEIARGLLHRGHRISLVCRPGSWIADQLANGPAEIILSDLHRWPLDELRRIAKRARDQHVDVIHTHMSRANFFGVLLRRLYKIPCVATANNRHIQLHWMFNDYVVAASEATRRFHRRFNLVPSNRIGVIHNFIDDHVFHQVDVDARNRLRDEFGIDRDALVLSIVGDVIARKGLLYLVRALPTIAAAVPTVHVLSIGHIKDAYGEQVVAEAARYGVAERLTLAGARADIAPLLSTSDLFVLPTLEDTLPLAILEAMASGLPVVATTVGGIPECVIDGQTGRLVPPGDPQQLADALIELLCDEPLRRQWGTAGRERVHRFFSRSAQIVRWEQILRRIAA